MKMTMKDAYVVRRDTNNIATSSDATSSVASPEEGPFGPPDRRNGANATTDATRNSSKHRRRPMTSMRRRHDNSPATCNGTLLCQ